MRVNESNLATRNMRTFREFGEARGVSYEAIRKKVMNHEPQISDGIVIVNGVRYLTESAQEYLDKETRTAYAKMDSGAAKKSAELYREENEALRRKIIELQDKLLAGYSRDVFELSERLKAVERKVNGRTMD